MKQTAVEWLFLMLNNPNRNQEFDNKLLKQAKAMEKEQIIRAHLMSRSYDSKNSVNDAEQYYNETFK